MLFSLGTHGWCASLSLSEVWDCLVLPLRCCYLADGSSWELLQQQWGGDTATHIWVQEPHQAAQQCVRSQGLKDEALLKFQIVSSYCFSLSFVKYSVCLKR